MILGLEFEAKGRTPPSTNPKHCTLPPPSGQNRWAVAVPNQTQPGPKVKQHLRESLFPFISRFEEFTSVKISNNALNFLLAQYRAIFKRAYIKGIASAVILTAGLAAGQAQAADNDKWYTYDSSTGMVEHEHDTNVASGSLAIGAGEHSQLNFASDDKLDGFITGGKLTVGSSNTAEGLYVDIARVSGTGGLGDANGGYIFSDANSSITNFTIDDSHVTLLSGGTIDERMNGAVINVAKGNVTANDNTATINAGTVGLSVYGANITTGDGSATASGNQAIVKADVADTISIGDGNWSALRGARAEGTDTISLTGNSVNIEISDSNKSDSTTRLTFDKADTLEGALGVIGAKGGTDAQAVIAQNSVTANNIKIGDSKGAYIFGGRGQVDSDNTNGVEITARNNTVSLTDTDVISLAADVTGGESLQIVGNTATAMQTTVSNGRNNVRALGDGTTANVYIDGGNLQFTGASTLADNASGLQQSSMVAGGFAITSASGGSATANANVVSIKNTTATNVSLYGGIAYSVKAAGSDQVTASQNVLTIDATDVNVDSTTAKSYTYNNIAGAVAFADPEGNGSNDKLTAQNTVTASQNVVTITNSTYKDADANTAKTIKADVYGALISTGAKATNEGKAVTVANQNSVKIDKGLNVTGSVFGVLAGFNGSFTGNSVDVNAKVAAEPTAAGAITPETVAGVFITAGDTSGTATEPATLTATNNTVTIGADAELTNTNIVAVDLGYNNHQNTNVIHSGNTVTVSGTYIVNDAANKYNLAGDDVQITSTALIHVKNGTLNISGIADGAAVDSAKYYNGTGTVAAGARIANADTINVYNSLDVQGDDSLFAVSTGAELKIDAGSAVAETVEKAEDAVTPEKATLKISQAGLTNYLTATKDLAYDLDGDASQVKEAKDAAGAVTVTSGGTIDFKDTVLLSDFDFTSGATAVAGKIKVDTSLTGGSGSNFKADTVTVAHKLATNTTTAQGKYGNLTALDDTDGVAIVANTLNLGSADLSSDRSAAITFGQATVKEEINFIAKTSGDNLNDSDGLVNATQKVNDGYHLTSKVIGSNYMLTNDQDAAKEYYTSLPGNINGVVTIEGSTSDSGELIIQDGDWTANDLVTVTSGGSITVGGESAVSGNLTPLDGVVREPDATLSLAAGLVLDVTNGDVATVTANGDTGSVYREPEDDFYGDNRYVALDLTHGVEMKIDANGDVDGKAVIEAVSGGVVLLNASDVNDMLAQNHANGVNNTSGAFFNASAGGELRVDGDITAQFRDFDNDADADTNGFNLSAGQTGNDFDKTSGRLVADSLTIVNPHNDTVEDDAEYLDTAQKVYLGGAVIVDDLEINDLQQTNGENKPAGTNTYASQVTIANGGAIISNSLTSYNDKLILGDEGTSSAILYFETDTVGAEGTISVNKIELASGSEIDFANGEWDASATNFILSGAGSSLIVGDDYDHDINDNPYYATLEAGDLTMGADTYLHVAANGTASFNGANLAELTAPTDTNDEAGILVEGYLTINGTAISDNNTNGGVTFGEAGSIRIANNGTLNFGSAAVNGAILADGQYSGDTVTLRPGYTKIENKGGTLRLGFASGSSFSSAAVQDLKHKLFTEGSFSDGVLANGGLLNLGSATFGKFTGYVAVNNPEEGLSGWTASWSDVKQDSDLFSEIEDVTTDQMSQSNITGINPGDEVKGAWGSLSMVANVPNTAQVTLAGNTTLSYAEGNNGFFISDEGHDNALGAIVGAQKAFNLVNGGKIGKVTLTNGKDDANDERNLTTLNINGNGNLTTINGIDTLINNGATTAYNTRVNVNSDADVTGDITGVGRVNVNAGATLHVYNPDDTSKDVPEVLVNTLAVRNGTAQIDGDLIIDGQYNSQTEGFGGDGEAYAIGGKIAATNIELEHHADLTTVHSGLISAETLTAVADTNGKSDSLIAVGNDLDYETWDDAEETSYTGTGYLEVSKYLDLNGGTLMVDPAYGEATSVAAVMNFKDGSDKTWDSVTNDVGIIDGKALIGKNAALGIGATLAETREAIADFQENGSLSQEKYGSILYLNGQLTVANGSEIALNADPVTSDVDGIRRALKYTITSNKLDQFATLGLGANTAILMSEAAFEDADGKKTGTAIHFDRDAAVINANGGEIVLIGAFDASEKLNFFSDNDSGNQNGVDIVNASGADGTIKVYTQNGFLFATLKGKNQGQDVQLHVDEEKAFSVMSEASYPIVQTLISYHEDRLAPDSSDTGANNGTGSDTGSNAGTDSGAGTVAWTEIKDNATKTAQAETKAGETTDLTKVEPQTNNDQTTTAPATKVTGSSSFLNEVVTASHGAPAEQAARLAVYGGAAQVGLAAANSNSDILESRFGIGANAQSLNVAQNGMGGTLWVAPIYKSQDSDGFDAQGLDYGVDFDLYGVALGGDYKVTNEITVGAMFNVGSGSLDGQGNAAAAGTSNDFDYFGFALYGAYQAGALTVTGDLSYTQIDNDLEGSNQVGKLTASSDTSAWSLGVTGQYQFTFASVDVTPHAGLRFTSLDLDDYSLEAAGHGTIANYDGDTMSVFSIPVGVTFAKSFEGESWTVTPALDLHVTGQFGDDEAEGSVAWTGTNLSTSVTSEVFDNFTYGATLGVEAQSNSFSFGVGLGYTGSSNVDEFGVNANARFTF